MHADQKLYLVFEFLDVDLKRYMELGNQAGKPITPPIVKVSRTYSPCLDVFGFPFVYFLGAWVIYAPSEKMRDHVISN